MKLAILGTRGIPARYGGYETFADRLSRLLVQQKIDVTVYCPSPEPREDIWYEGVRLRHVPYPNAGPFSEVVWDIHCLWRAQRGFDVVYMLGVGASCCCFLPRLHGAEVWINTDGLEWKRAKWSRAQRLYLAISEALAVLLANRVIADAEAIGAYLKRRYFGIARVVTIAYGADENGATGDAELLADLGLSAGEFYSVICRLEPENHVIEILEGHRRSGSTRPLVVLGDIERPNAYVRSLLAYADARVRFLGTIYDADRLSALRAGSAAYLHGHSVGGTNPSLLEAMASGNQVIAHDNVFNREVLGADGLFFSDPDVLAGLLARVEAEPADAGLERGARLRERVRRHYSWQSIADRYAELLRTVQPRVSRHRSG